MDLLSCPLPSCADDTTLLLPWYDVLRGCTAALIDRRVAVFSPLALRCPASLLNAIVAVSLLALRCPTEICRSRSRALL